MQVLIKEVAVKNILTKSNLPVSDYSVNPYIGCPHSCMYCYASFIKRFTGHNEPWGSFLDVKKWQPLNNIQKYANKEIFIGSVTDPYLPQEEKYQRTRTFLEQLQGSNARISITTKSDLILRDLDLIKSFPQARVAWSINTLNEEFRRDMDCAVSIERRLHAMQTFYQAGIRTTCFISPIFPQITEVKDIILRTKGICNFIWLENLNLRGSYKRDILKYIQQKYPTLLPLYLEIYQDEKQDYWQYLDQDLQQFTKQLGLEYVINQDPTDRPFNAPPIIVNYFYHEKVKKSAQKAKAQGSASNNAKQGSLKLD